MVFQFNRPPNGNGLGTPKTSSLVSLVGQVKGEVKDTVEGVRFAVTCKGSGTFYVNGGGHFSGERIDQLKAGDKVLVYGTLGSFHFRACHQHHVYIQPQAIVLLSAHEVHR